MTSTPNITDCEQQAIFQEQNNSLQSPSEVFERIRAQPAQTNILVDFDETLLLENSTESYLNSLQPRLLGYLFLSLLNLLGPWNWLPKPLKGSVSKDWCRVLLSTLLFPWTPLVWKFRSKRLAQTQVNPSLAKALNQRQDCNITIASLGFGFIIQPVVAQIPLSVKNVIACRFWQGGTDRAQGKLEMVKKVLSDADIASSMLITDSQDDALLLDAVSSPCLFVWPNAKYIPAMTNLYIPFYYTEKVKKPGASFFIREVIGNDFIVLILATSCLQEQPFLHGSSMALCMLSFLCIYEMGYMENDLLGERFEKNPTLSALYIQNKQKINFWQPWLWSACFAIPGLLLLHVDSQLSPLLSDAPFSAVVHNGFWIKLITWTVFLVFVRIFFSFYNRIDKYSRVWLYPILQAFKSFSFLLITTTNLVGAMLFSSTILSYWLPYIIYRYTKEGWPKSDFAQLFRLLSFIFLIIAVVAGTQDFSLLLSGQVLAIFIYIAFRSSKSLLRLIRSAKPVQSDQW